LFFNYGSLIHVLVLGFVVIQQIKLSAEKKIKTPLANLYVFLDMLS